jgi:hypothetical protein
MLISKKEIIDACSLPHEQVKQALTRGGYKDHDFTAAEFKGMTDTGTFVYKITYIDGDGDEAYGQVYLSYKRSPFRGDFDLVGDY